MTRMFLGVDGGGTRCRMRLADASLKTIAEAQIDAPSNLQVENGDAAFAAIGRLTDLVFARAGLDIGQAANVHACFGMAGARLLKARENFAARPFPFASAMVVDDIDIARAGAHLGADGAVLIIGTGSAGLGLACGKRFQVGGWGFLVGDEMSGAWLGRKLLRRSLRAFEGLEKGSALCDAVMEIFDDDPQKLMEWSFRNPAALADHDPGHSARSYRDRPLVAHARPVDYGAFVPMIFDFLEQGDPVAAELLALEMEQVESYMRWFLHRGIDSIAVVGGLGQRLLPMLEESHPGLVIRPRSSPLNGAVILAAASLDHDNATRQHSSGF